MSDISNSTYNTKPTSTNSWPIIILLFASFMWASVYPVVGNVVNNYWLGFGNLFDTSNMAFSNVVLWVVASAFGSWVLFEIIFYLYRFWLSGNIYSFIVPADKIRYESRVFFIYRNLIFGLFVNLCFFVPYLYTYINFIDLIVTMSMALIYVCHLNKAYSEPIIGHFVFKCFIYPVFVFEIVSIIWQVVEVLL